MSEDQKLLDVYSF